MQRPIFRTTVLLFFFGGFITACVVKPKYPILQAEAAKLGFDAEYIIRLGDLVNSAYAIFHRQTKEGCFSPNPPFPEESALGFEPIFNLQGVDNPKLQNKEFYGHVSWKLPSKKTLVISIRGTSDAQEWAADAKYSLVPYSSNPEDGKVERGFHEIFKSLTVSFPKQQLCSESDQNQAEFTPLASYLSELEDVEEVVVVGHSLGSSLAALVAFQTKQTLPNSTVKLLTFASPLTGDAAFVKAFQSRIQNSVRVVNRPDIVPRVPPPMMGYEHVWHQLSIDSYPISEIKRSLICYHSLDTYLYLLRGKKGKLAVACQQD